MTAQTILPANTLSSGYNVANSARFDIAGTDTLRLAAAGSNGDMKHWTISMWIKRSKLGALQHVWSWSRNSTNAEGGFAFDANDQLFFINDGQNGSTNEIDGRWRDPASWMHLVWSCDADDGTNANRWKVYINGVQKTLTGGPTISDATGIINQGSTQEHWIGGRARSLNANVADASYFSGYLAEVVFIDDATLDPTSFGEFDSDSPTIWKPIDVSGLTFGAEGYYLDFQNASELGTDVSGNSNTLAENSMDATNQSTDTCTNNFATMNSVANFRSGVGFTDGNLGVAMTNNKGGSTSTFGLTTGKWYVEMNITTMPADERFHLGINPFEIQEQDDPISTTNQGIGLSGFNAVIYADSGSGAAVLNNFFGNNTTRFDSFTGIIGMALDITNGTIAFSKAGDWVTGSGTTDSDFSNALKVDISTALARHDTWHVTCGSGNSSGTTGIFSMNFGSPAFSISSGNADGNGYGNFEYAVPSGYYSINSKNLAKYG